MSQAFFERFTELLFGVIMILLLFLGTIMVLLAYVLTQIMVFYYAYIGALFFSFFYAFRYAQQFKHFKETLNLFIPSENSKPIEPLNIDVEDRALKVCLYYQQGAKLEDIAKDLGLNHHQQVKRELRKGLSILLRFYNEHREAEKVEYQR
jgi:ABC-type multidrug transport system fused ATPase/permease subunit